MEGTSHKGKSVHFDIRPSGVMLECVNKCFIDYVSTICRKTELWTYLPLSGLFCNSKYLVGFPLSMFLLADSVYAL